MTKKQTNKKNCLVGAGIVFKFGSTKTQEKHNSFNAARYVLYIAAVTQQQMISRYE